MMSRKRGTRDEDATGLQQTLPGTTGNQRPILRMHLNENLVLPPNFIRLVLAKCVDRYDPRFYPAERNEEEMQSLIQQISRYAGCPSEFVGLGVGADQIIDILLRMKLRKPQDRLVTVDPTFPWYSEFAKRIGAGIVEIPLGSSTNIPPFSLKKDRLVRVCKQKGAKICAIASPNNPTGLQYPLDEIRDTLESIPREVTVLLDEAYVEYARYSSARLVNSYPNLVVVRTFSKAFALASLRLGYFLCPDPDFVQSFWNNFQYPYPIAGFSIILATEMMRRRSVVLEWANRTKIFRKELIDSLSKLQSNSKQETIRVIPESDANFVLAQSEKAKKLSEQLKTDYGIFVKHFPKLGSETNFLRITVASRESNQKLLYAMRRLLVK